MSKYDYDKQIDEIRMGLLCLFTDINFDPLQDARKTFGVVEIAAHYNVYLNTNEDLVRLV